MEFPFRHALICGAAALAFSASSLRADSPLLLFGRVSGKCFSADVGSGAKDMHCFAPILGSRHLRDSHRVVLDHKVIYLGETTYSSEAGVVVFSYINGMGGVGHGNARPTPGGVAFTGTMRADAHAHPQSMDSRWTWRPDGYEVSDTDGKPVIYRQAMSAAP